MSAPCSNSHAMKICSGCRVCSTTLDVWGHRGPGEVAQEPFPVALPCSALSSMEQHQKLHKMQSKGTAVPRNGQDTDTGLT